MTPNPKKKGFHPIQVVVRRTGISADVLRAWEKRYEAVTPTRSDTGRRLYSDADIERLLLIKEAMAGGRRIGDVATRSRESLEQLIREDQRSRTAAAPGTRATPVASFVADALAAVRRADQLELRAVLTRALFALSPTRFVNEIATPFMHEVGAAWERGELSPGHEHIATEVIRQLLSEVLDMLAATNGARSVVVATPRGQRHEIGALFAATSAALDGFRVTYLGADLPAEDIGRIALETGAAAIALSVTSDDAGLGQELSALSATVGDDLPILLGGQRAASAAENAGRGVIVLNDVESFRATLSRLA